MCVWLADNKWVSFGSRSVFISSFSALERLKMDHLLGRGKKRGATNNVFISSSFRHSMNSKKGEFLFFSSSTLTRRKVPSSYRSFNCCKQTRCRWKEKRKTYPETPTKKNGYMHTRVSPRFTFVKVIRRVCTFICLLLLFSRFLFRKKNNKKLFNHLVTELMGEIVRLMRNLKFLWTIKKKKSVSIRRRWLTK